GSLHNALAHQLVECQPGFVALAVAQPADTRGQPLEMDFLAGQRDPAFQRSILREEFENSLVGAIDIFGVARERDPTERPLATAEEGTNIGGHEAREV